MDINYYEIKKKLSAFMDVLFFITMTVMFLLLIYAGYLGFSELKIGIIYIFALIFMVGMEYIAIANLWSDNS